MSYEAINNPHKIVYLGRRGNSVIRTVDPVYLITFIMKKTLISLCAAIMAVASGYGRESYTMPISSGSAGLQSTSISGEGYDVIAPPPMSYASVAASRWRFGGSIGFNTNDRYTHVNIAPQIGYAITNGITVGGGVSYTYYDNKKYDYTENYFGMHLYARAYPIRYITLYAQPELQRRWGKDRQGKSESELIGCFLLGGGFVIPTGPNGGMSITFYYDVIQDNHSPYGNHIGYSIGYTIRL